MGGQQSFSLQFENKEKQKINSSGKEKVVLSQCETEIIVKLLVFLVGLDTEYRRQFTR